jgi:hypothetical protein
MRPGHEPRTSAMDRVDREKATRGPVADSPARLLLGRKLSPDSTLRSLIEPQSRYQSSSDA